MRASQRPNQDHVFIEVTADHSVAAVRTDRRGKPLAAFSETVSATSDFLAIAAGLEDVVFHPFALSYTTVAVTHNTWKRLRDAWISNKTGKWPFHSESRWLYLEQLAWPLLYTGQVPDCDLDTLTKAFQIECNLESLTGRCEASMLVYWAMMGRYSGALKTEEVVREVGGKPLATVRRIVGL